MHLFLLLLACRDNQQTVPGVGSAAEAEPDLRVTPDAVAFGAVTVGSTATEAIVLLNTGDAELEILGLELDAAELGAVYTLSSNGAGTLLPGESATIELTFTPNAEGAFDTRLGVESNLEPTSLTVTAEGVAPVPAPDLVITPEAHDFGALYVGCEASAAFTLANSGTADLLVTDLDHASASDDLALDANEAVNGPLPWTVAPGASVEVFGTYAPLEEVTASGAFTVTSNDPGGVEVASLTGSGVTYATNLETFDHTSAMTVDIVFHPDLSTTGHGLRLFQSMFEPLVDGLLASGMDYQLAIALEDDGCVAGDVPFVDASMAPEEQVAHLRAMYDEVSSGVGLQEQGFTVLDLALSATNVGAGGCNEGLLRDGTLALVGVTDEAEQSSNPWSYYVSRYEGLMAHPDRLTVNAIAGDYPAGCEGYAPGEGWYQASVATNGLFLSMCETDWSLHVDALVEMVTFGPPLSYDLSHWPVPGTIEVRVDGVLVTEGWEYNQTDLSLDFTEASAPQAGSVLEVTYTRYGECEE